MGKLEKYSSYKDSGVEWLGEIPKHWEIKKLKFLTRNLNNRRIPIESTIRGRMENRIYDYYGATGVIDKVENYIFDEPTIIIAEDGANLLLRNIKLVYLADEKYWVNNHAHILKTILGNNRYFIANALENNDYTTLISGSAQPKLTKENLSNVLLAVPPQKEQTKIASFLDEKTAQIDELISRKQKLIELLKEQKQIVINDAVTKGLDKDIEFVDSGVEWIGEIPKHWEILPLKTCTKLKSIKNAPDLELLSVYLDFGVIRFKDVEQKRTNVTSTDLSDYQLVDKGDFVLNNQQAWRGSVGVSKYKGIISPAYIVLKLSDKFNSIFANYYFRNGLTVSQYLINSKGVGTIQRNLYWGSLKQTYISIPPKDEQIKIVEYIENQTTKIDKAIELQQNYISKLKEYKATLIDSVVTGKVRVV